MYVLRGGVVVDPDQDLEERLDVLVEGERIEALLPSGSPCEATSIDVAGAYVTPGLIDLHGHWWEGSPWGIDATVSLGRGVTTVCDAGTAGYESFPAFRRMAIERSPVRILAFLNIAAVGLPSMLVGEVEDLRFARVDEAVAMIGLNADVIIGVKVRLGSNTCGPNIAAAFDAALEAAHRAGVRLMVHVAEGVALPAILMRLREGDIVTHTYRHGGARGLLLDAGGQVVREAFAAQDRGVVFDVGHGCGSFAWDIYRPAVEQGFSFDTISTDLHRLSVDGPVYDLPTTMSKFLHAGLSLSDVVAAATTRPAAAIGRRDDLGTLRLGRRADIAVLRIEDGTFDYADAFGGVELGTRRLVPVMTINGGSIVRPDDVTIALRPLTNADREVGCGVPPSLSPP